MEVPCPHFVAGTFGLLYGGPGKLPITKAVINKLFFKLKFVPFVIARSNLGSPPGLGNNTFFNYVYGGPGSRTRHTMIFSHVLSR